MNVIHYSMRVIWLINKNIHNYCGYFIIAIFTQKMSKKIESIERKKIICKENFSHNLKQMTNAVKLLTESVIQESPRISKSNFDIYVTGSNSKFLSSDIITEFRGRGDEIRVYPLSFSEYFSAVDMSFDRAWQDYIIYGGMPLILSQPTDSDKIRYLSNLVNQVYLSDIINRHHLRGLEEVGELMNIIASNIGALTNPKRIANTFQSESKLKLTQTTISTYLDYFIDSFIIQKAFRYDIKGNKYINSTIINSV